MTVIWSRLLSALVVLVYAASQFVEYQKHHRIILLNIYTAEGQTADIYYYVLWLIVIVGIVLVVTSFKKANIEE